MGIFRFSRALLCAVALLAPPARAETYALLIGINDYPRARHLQGALNDIQQIRRVLLEDLSFPERNITQLLNDQATKANILAALRKLADESKPGDTLLWYYSGHGWMMDDVDGDEALLDPFDKYDEVLIPYDAVPFPKEHALDPNSTFVSDDEIGRALSHLLGRRLIVIFDSCHSGTATKALPGDDPGRSLYQGVPIPNAPKYRSLTRPPETFDIDGQMVFIAASGPLETASDLGEYEHRRHGALTASLLRTMKKIGPGWQRTTTWDGLFRQARQELLSQGFAAQTPSLTSRGGLSKLTVEEFFHPSAAGEISGLQSAGTFPVQLETNKYRFEDGELLELAMESARDGYLYIFDINADHNVTQLFPNTFSQDNRVQAGALRMVPAKSDRYQFRAGKPYGHSTIVAIVTTQPWSDVSRLQLPASFQPISDFQATALRSRLRALEGITPGGLEWSSQKVLVEIVPKGAPVEAVPPVSRLEPTTSAAPAPVATAAPATSAAAPSLDLDDSNLSPEDQADLPNRRPALFQKLSKLAERFSPVFWQDVSGSYGSNFRPWKDFFVRFDFDQTELGPNWPAPPQFQDENKRNRNHSLDAWLKPGSRRHIVPLEQAPGVFRVTDEKTGETVQLDLRPYVYWAVITSPTHYFFHYVCFKAEDWKFLFGHPGDLEGTTIVVDRQTEKMLAAFTLAHDDVHVTRSLDDTPEPNIEVLVDPALASRALFSEDDGRPINGSLTMEAGRDGEPAPKEHQDVYSESRGHGQYGPHKIVKSRYVIYASFLPGETWRAPSFEKEMYPLADKFGDVPSRHKYQLVYIGAGRGGARSPQDRTLWSEYRDLGRFPGGANPPWCWRDNLFFSTGWWKDPQMIKKIGDPSYRFNPYR